MDRTISPPLPLNCLPCLYPNSLSFNPSHKMVGKEDATRTTQKKYLEALLLILDHTSNF